MNVKALGLGLAVAGLVGLLGIRDSAVATPALNFNSETLSKVTFDEILVNPFHRHWHGGHKGHDGKGHDGLGHDDRDDDDGADSSDDYKVRIIARDPSDVYIVRNTVPPGGYSGWHTHPGPSVVSVTAGTATVYDGDDPSCTPVKYPAGTGFIDPGDGHVHMVRNEGTVDLVVVAFQVIPTGAARRIDAPAPGYCGF
jgi:hypothetical protein